MPGIDLGVEVKAGAAKPDVSSVDAFKRTLLAAKSIAYLKEGQSGLAVAKEVRGGFAQRDCSAAAPADLTDQLVSPLRVTGHLRD